MKNKIHSEYRFEKEVSKDEWINLTLYINYEKKTYDFMQDCQEGIFPRTNNTNTDVNKAYFELGLDIIKFVKEELKI